MSSALMSGTPDGKDDDFGGFDLDEIFNGDKPLDAVQKALAGEFLFRSEQIQLERLQCISDGATLGAEQVQDVRLQLLEKGPEVSTAMVVADLFIGFLLDSSLAGLAVKKFASATCKAMVNRNLLLLSGSRSKAAQIMGNLRNVPAKGNNKYYWEQSLEALSKNQLKAESYMAGAARWQFIANVASNSDRNKDAVAVMKAGVKYAQKKTATSELTLDGDTTGVSLLSSISEFSSRNRLVVKFQYARMRTLVAIGSMSGREARSFLRLAEFDEVEEPLKIIRDRCKIMFEAIIWAGMFGFDRDNYLRFTERDGFKGIDGRLVDYWLKRFANEIVRWNKEMSSQELFNLRRDRVEVWSKLDKLQKIGLLDAYFNKVLNELPQNLSESNALISQLRK